MSHIGGIDNLKKWKGKILPFLIILVFLLKNHRQNYEFRHFYLYKI